MSKEDLKKIKDRLLKLRIISSKYQIGDVSDDEYYKFLLKLIQEVKDDTVLNLKFQKDLIDIDIRKLLIIKFKLRKNIALEKYECDFISNYI